MFVCCECCMLSGRGLCDELITCLEESYRLWCVVVWSRNHKNPHEWGGGQGLLGGYRAKREKTKCNWSLCLMRLYPDGRYVYSA